MYWLKTPNIDYVTISMGQKFRSSFTRWFWLRVFHEVVVKMLSGAAAI